MYKACTVSRSGLLSTLKFRLITQLHTKTGTQGEAEWLMNWSTSCVWWFITQALEARED